jgi:hypothetical protein
MAETPRNQERPPAGPLWTIGWDDGSLPQEIETVYPLSGQEYDQWRVKFTTRSGIQGHVVVPADHYDATTVAAAITPLAQEMEDVHHLQGPEHPGE